MKSVSFCGNIIIDSIKEIPWWPEQGMLAPISSLRHALGGSVSNTSIDLKTLDPSVVVKAIGKVGTDGNGDLALAGLQKRGIDVSGVLRVDAPTTFTDVMAVTSSGQRTFFNMHGADSLLTPEDIDPAKLDCDIFHLGYLLLLDGLDAPDDEYGTKAARLLAKVRAAGIRTSVDIVSEQSERFARIVRPALKHCDYLIVNEIEGARATGLPAVDASGKVTVGTLSAIAAKLFELGVREKVVLHCPDLSVARDAAGHVVAVPSLDLPKDWIKGSVGAGDAFCAGMLLAILKDMDLEAGMRLASCAAAANLASADATGGALPLAETLALEAKFTRKQIKEQST